MIKKQHIVSVILYCAVILVSLLFWSNASFSGEIHNASKNGDLAKVKLLVEKNHELLSSKDEHDITPLYYATLNGHKEVVEYMIESGCDVNEKIKNGMTPLSSAAFKYKDIVLLLLNKGADVNMKSYSGNTALHFAVSNGNHEIAELLLDKGADVNAADNEGFTSLSLAVIYQNKAMVEILIQRGADVNAKNRDGWTPLHSALMLYPDDIAKILEKHGAVDLPKDDKVIKGNDLPFIPERLKEYPIHYAAWNGDLDGVKTMLKKNRELLNSKDYSQSTPLLVATVAGNVSVVQFLLDQGADVTLSNSIGWVPEVAASYTQYEELVEIIRKYSKHEEISLDDIMKDKPFIPERLVQYPIHNAALNGDLSKVKSLLLKNSALLNVRDYSQSTPLLVATYAGKKDVMQFLLEKGADIYISNTLGMTPATVAAFQRRIDLLEMIRKYKKNTTVKYANADRVQNNVQQNELQEEKELYNAIYLCDISSVDVFLRKHPERFDNKKINSLLVTAAISGDKGIIDFFVKKGADVNAREWGWMPLHKAAENNNLVAVKTLLDFHADINCKANNGYTPLHLAATQGHAKIVDLLIKRGADVNAHDNYGNTPLNNAIKNNHKDVIILIRNAEGKEE